LKRTDEPNAFPKNPNAIESRIRERLREFVVDGDVPSGVPHLAPDMSFELATAERVKQIGPNKVKVREPYNSYDEAWAALITQLKNFRQVRPMNTVWNPIKRKNVPRPGRNKWNEPERIREITKQRWPDHTKNVDLAGIEGFPRAAFGQPILFQFHRDQKSPPGSSASDRDPIDTTLKGGPIPGQTDKYRERLASPLILRPLACSGTKSVGLSAILKTPRLAPEGLYLIGEGINKKLDLRITKKDAQKIGPLRSFTSSLPGDTDEVDVLEAFIVSFRPAMENKKK
jgi:CRISPR/Cas system CMR-associated protein Cmr1 (group 7 of RAMP superfamily)